MTRAERKLANALRRVIAAVDDYAAERFFDGDQDTRRSARRVDTELAKARAALRSAEGLLQPARALPHHDILGEEVK